MAKEKGHREGRKSGRGEGSYAGDSHFPLCFLPFPIRRSLPFLFLLPPFFSLTALLPFPHFTFLHKTTSSPRYDDVNINGVNFLIGANTRSPSLSPPPAIPLPTPSYLRAENEAAILLVITYNNNTIILIVIISSKINTNNQNDYALIETN